MSFYPPFFFKINRAINFEIFLRKKVFSWSCRFTYILSQHFILSFLVHFQLWIYLWKATIKIAIFSDVILVSEYPGCKREAIKLILYYMLDVIYKIIQIVQNINNLTFQAIYIFWLNSKKANHRFYHPFLLLGETYFRKNAAWGNE